MMKALLFLGFFAVLFCPPAFAGPPFPPPPFLIPVVPISVGPPSPAQSLNIIRAAVQLNRTEKEIEQQLGANQMMEQQDWGNQVTEQQLLVNETLRNELKEAEQKKTGGEEKREPVIIVGK